MTKSYYNFSPNLTTGTAFLATGAATGAGIYTTIGGVGLVGSFGGIGLGMIPLIGVGTVVGAATFGGFQAISEGDKNAWGSIGLGAVSGIGIYSTIGGVGLGFAGTAVKIGMGTMGVFGGIVGLGLYGVAKLIDNAGSGETAFQAFERMEEKILDQDFYIEALWEVIELSPEFADQKLKQKFDQLEIEDEFKALKAKINNSNKSFSSVEKEYNPKKHNNASKPKSRKIVMAESSPYPTWESLITLKGHLDQITGIGFSSDSNKIISTSQDKTVNLWDLKTGERTYTFFNNDEIYSLVVSSKFPIFAMGDRNGKINTWNWQNRQFIQVLFDRKTPEFKRGRINSLALSKNSQILISGNTDKTIKIWNRLSDLTKRILHGHTEAVLSVCLTPNEQYIVSGSADKTIRIWGLTDYKEPRILTGHSQAVTAVLLSPDGKILISGSSDSTVKFWDFQTGELIHTLREHSAGICSVAVSPDGETLATVSLDGNVKLWKFPTGELRQTLEGNSVVAFSPDGKFLATVYQNRILKIWHQTSTINPLNDLLRQNREWWKILGVNKNVDADQVKQAYYKLARLYHPDVNSSKEAVVKMQLINQAYQQFLTHLDV